MLPRASLLLAVSVAACSSSPTGSDASGGDAGDAFDTGGDGAAPGDAGSADGSSAPDAIGSPDASSDASALAQLAACLGTSKPLTISAQMPYLAVPVGAESGDFVLDFGSTFSSIDPTAFAPPGPSTSGCDPNVLGDECTVAGFSFFGPPASVTLTIESFSGLGGAVRQAGIIGTDFLSEDVITLAYGASLAFASPSTGFCSDAALAAAGLAPLSAAGFYENDLSALAPATSVDSAAPSGETVADVPTVPVRVAGASALAQLDTGFDDDVTPLSVNINEAFYEAIAAASPSALVRDSSLDTTLTTCVSGVSEPVTGYRLAAGTTFDFLTTGSAAARSYAGTALFVKNTPSAAHECGGIGTWTVPAAQVAASYFNDMGLVVFDPYSARVWIPTQ